MASIVAAALLVDTSTVALLQASGLGGDRVREWYRTLRVGAYAMDVLSLIIGAYIARLVAPDAIWAQLALVVVVQMAHDLAFGMFVQSPYAKGPLMSLFRRYAEEMGAHILWADAAMMVATVLAAHGLSRLTADASAFVGVVSAYLGLLLVYSF